uniref:Uncharacterized protein n=1 Tax=Anguilla anguilla TaxID=7936 RepID=A0A0E9RLQ6_ANGAN
MLREFMRFMRLNWLHFILLHVQPCWPIFVPNHVLSSSALLFLL